MKADALIINDPHIDVNNLKLVESIFKQSLKLAEELRIKRIIITGDVFNVRPGQNLFCLLLFMWYAEQFAKSDCHLYVIAGNHDKIDQNIPESYVDVVGSYSGVTVIKQESIVFMGQGKVYAFLPYFLNEEYYRRLTHMPVASKSWGKVEEYLFTHKDINGVRNNDGEFVVSGTPSELFKRYKKVFVGHYHNSQKVGSNIYYTGSVFSHNYGEDNNKGFTILYDDGTHKIVPAEFPKYIALNFDAGTDKVAIAKAREKYSNSADHIRFNISGSEEQLMGIENKHFEEVGIEVKKESVKMMRALNLAEDKVSVEFNKQSIKRYFLEYCAQNKVEPERRKLGFKYINAI